MTATYIVRGAELHEARLYEEEKGGPNSKPLFHICISRLYLEVVTSV